MVILRIETLKDIEDNGVVMDSLTLSTSTKNLMEVSILD